MLVEIRCDKFMSNGIPREPIKFRRGLNVVLGADAAENSIGKSTFLMIIDFVFGGNDYVLKSIDVHKNVLDHAILFSFVINGEAHFFLRETVNHTSVWRCDANYEKVEEIALEAYHQLLLDFYGINLFEIKFRNMAGRYFRVYGRDNLDERQPLHAAKGEKETVISLMKLFNRYEAIAQLSVEVKKRTDEKTTHRKAQALNFIPKITKTQYKANDKRINLLNEELDNLHANAGQELFGLESKEAEAIAELRQKITNARRNKSRLWSQLKSIENDMAIGRAPHNVKQITLETAMLPDFNKLLKFFPNADIRKIREIENFHTQMADVLYSEFESAKRSISAMIELADKEIYDMEQQIQKLGVTPKISKVVLESYADKKNEITRLQRDNGAYDTMATLAASAKELKNKLDVMREEQTITIQNDINVRMSKLNDFVYDSEKKSPVLNIKNTNSYTFFTPDDTGTGTSYKGLIVFDLSILELTDLPAIVHDSILLKQIADEPLEKIMILYAESEKQVFIALDKKGAYTEQTQALLEENTVLHLSPGGNELFGWAWNEKTEDIGDSPVIQREDGEPDNEKSV